MNFNSVISFLLACSSANSATTRNSNIPSSKSHNATASPVLSSCLECGDGYRLSTCSETPQLDSDNGTDPFLGLTTNASLSCLLYTEGTNGANITRTCLCEKVTNGTGRGSQKIPGDKKGTLAVDALITVLSFIVFPASVILLCILCRKRHQAETSSTIHPFQHEADSNDVRKQRECVLEILFPPASEGEKDGSPSQTVSKEQSQKPMSEIDDLESNEGKLDDSVIDVARCSICLEQLGTKRDDGKDIVVGQCSHSYHRECLLSWLKEPGHDFCPDCRQRMWDPKLYAMVKASLVGVQGMYPGHECYGIR